MMLNEVRDIEGEVHYAQLLREQLDGALSQGATGSRSAAAMVDGVVNGTVLWEATTGDWGE